MARIEKRGLGDYGLSLRRGASKHFFWGLFWGLCVFSGVIVHIAAFLTAVRREALVNRDRPYLIGNTAVAVMPVGECWRWSSYGIHFSFFLFLRLRFARIPRST